MNLELVIRNGAKMLEKAIKAIEPVGRERADKFSRKLSNLAGKRR